MEDERKGSSRIENLKRLFRAVAPFLIVAVLFLALYLLYEALREYHYRDLVARLRSYSATIIFAALALTAINYVVLSLYDVLALRYVGAKLPYPKIAFTSFLSYVFSYNIGLSLFGSSALRYRFYSAYGVDGGSIARVIAFCVATFWIGIAVMGGGGRFFAPPSAVAAFPALAVSSRAIGAGLVAIIVVYLALCFLGKAEVRLRGRYVKLPRFRVALGQTLVASLDWCLAGAVLYILLPQGGRPPFLSFIAIFATAQLAGATSHVPGGVGVFETIIVLSLSSHAPSDALFGALLAYRGIYYLVPLSVAVIAFVARESYIARREVAKVAAVAARTFASLVPAVLAAVVFLSGTLLLFSGATPAAAGRLLFLDPFVPLPLLELSHFAASLVGLALLVIADALRRRIDAAYFFALLLLAAGALFSLLKGFDWEEAIVMGIVFVLLLSSRSLFHRRATILSPPSVQWLVALVVAFAGSVWLGLFSYKHVQYSHDLWWAFELEREAPRFLRASFGVMVGIAFVAFRMLLSPLPRMLREIMENCESDVRRILGIARSSKANLALLRDKFFHFGPERNSFLMYGELGRTIIVMGDPVGDEREFPDLLWSFYEIARRQGGRVVWYEITAKYLPIFVELGVRIHKIGEEAIVDLGEFTLAGGRGKRLRPPCNKLVREGYVFDVLSPGALASHLDELRLVSDEWLGAKKAREKGFSLGFFDERYLSNFPCAVVSKGGRITAFANLWSSGDNRELSVDLMRHTSDSTGGTMEFLFVSIMLWGKEHGYCEFNLGMAPLSGVDARDAAPLWNKVVSLIFRGGEGIYNFQGLRSFKEKFSPKWTARYIATSRGAPLPVLGADIARLIGRGRSTLS